MTMPSSPNSISFLQLKTEFQGNNPVSINQYYRDGGKVPFQKTVQTAQWVAKTYSLNVNSVAQTTGGPYGIIQKWDHNGITVYGAAGTSTQVSNSQSTTGFQFRRGTFQSTVTTPKSGNVAAYDTHYYVIERYEYVTSTYEVNQSVPVGNVNSTILIRMSDFYDTAH